MKTQNTEKRINDNNRSKVNMDFVRQSNGNISVLDESWCEIEGSEAMEYTLPKNLSEEDLLVADQCHKHLRNLFPVKVKEKFENDTIKDIMMTLLKLNKSGAITINESYPDFDECNDLGLLSSFYVTNYMNQSDFSDDQWQEYSILEKMVATARPYMLPRHPEFNPFDGDDGVTLGEIIESLKIPHSKCLVRIKKQFLEFKSLAT